MSSAYVGWLAAIVAIAFWILLLSGGFLIVLSRNRAAQRFFGAILTATILTAATDLYVSKALSPYAYLAIDGGLLVVAIFYVLKIDRYWPIWFAGLHFITVASEISRLTFSGPIPEMYANVAGFCFIPAFIAMIIGLNMDRRLQTLAIQ